MSEQMTFDQVVGMEKFNGTVKGNKVTCDRVINGHNIEIREIPPVGGVEEIEVSCASCMTILDTFDPVKYGKYRHAFNAAWKQAYEHAETTRV